MKQPSKILKDWSSRDLIKHVKDLDQMINDSECFSVSDCVNYENMILELENRGYTIGSSSKLVISK